MKANKIYTTKIKLDPIVFNAYLHNLKKKVDVTRNSNSTLQTNCSSKYKYELSNWSRITDLGFRSRTVNFPESQIISYETFYTTLDLQGNPVYNIHGNLSNLNNAESLSEIALEYNPRQKVLVIKYLSNDPVSKKRVWRRHTTPLTTPLSKKRGDGDTTLSPSPLQTPLSKMTVNLYLALLRDGLNT